MLWNSDDTIVRFSCWCGSVVLDVRTQEEEEDDDEAACFEIVYSMELRGTAKKPSF